jgi:uncharacterized protein YbjT (DUF2867 family)
MTILVTGGTGKTGRRVADRLTALDTPLRVATRHSEPRFDWYDDATWDRALAGCTAAWVTFQPDVCLPGADAILGAFARRAVALGCTRLVLLSGRGEDGARRAEAALTRSGAEWTILRSTFFFQNFTEAFWADEIATGSLTMVESTVGEPFVDADDIADVAVACLLDPVHSGRVHELAGPRLLTFEDVASLVAAGLPAEEATGLAQLFEEVLDGRNAHLDPGVEDVLGRRPRDFATFARDALTPAAGRG